LVYFDAGTILVRSSNKLPLAEIDETSRSVIVMLKTTYFIIIRRITKVLIISVRYESATFIIDTRRFDESISVCTLTVRVYMTESVKYVLDNSGIVCTGTDLVDVVCTPADTFPNVTVFIRTIFLLMSVDSVAAVGGL